MNDFYFNPTLNEWVIEVGGQVYYAETLTQAKKTFKETMRVQREHIERNPKNKEL